MRVPPAMVLNVRNRRFSGKAKIEGKGAMDGTHIVVVQSAEDGADFCQR
jgi:hypothetical protein